MPIVVFGPIALTATGQPITPSFGDLKKCAAKVVRGESQAKYLALAADGILAAIDDINMRHVFDFGSRRESDYTLVDGTQTRALETDFLAVRDVQLITASDSTAYATLEYLPWDQFNAMEMTQTLTGPPLYWTARNTWADQEILLYPVPDSGAAADYTLRVEYYARVPLPAADGDVIAAPREIGDILCTYGQYHILFVLDNQNSTAWGHKLSLYRDKLRAFRASRERVPNQSGHWQLGYESEPGLGVFDPLGD